MISSDFVVGDEEFIRTKINSSAQLPKTDKEKFLSSLDSNGKKVFESLFNFAEKENLTLRWGSKGFSINKTFGEGFVGLCFGYPQNSVYKQSIYTGFEEITKKIRNPEKVINFYKNEIEKFDKFEHARSNFKWVINRDIQISDIEKYIEILKQVIFRIEIEGLKNE